MSDQQVPGFYAVGDEDTFLVSMDGQVFEVVRGGMAGPILTRVDALPPGVPHELMDGGSSSRACCCKRPGCSTHRALCATSPTTRSMSWTRCCGAAPSASTWPTWTGSGARAAGHRGRPRRALAPLPAPARRALHDDLRAPLRRVGGQRGGRVTTPASSPRRSSGPGPRPSSSPRRPHHPQPRGDRPEPALGARRHRPANATRTSPAPGQVSRDIIGASPDSPSETRAGMAAKNSAYFVAFWEV
jgi:hypothetical protein